MNKYDAFLIKYAEIGIKGKNRHVFEEALVRQIRIALRPCEGRFAVSHAAPRPVQDGCGFHAGGVSGRDPYL